MKILVPVLALLALAALLPGPALAGTEMYLLGGGTLANLGGDASDYGQLQAEIVGAEIGDGIWTSSKRSLIGYQAGFGIGYLPPAGIVGVAAEAHFASRGTSWKLSDISGTYPSGFETQLRVSYAEIPVLVQLVPGEPQDAVRPVLLAGPVLGVHVHSEYSLALEEGGASSSADFGSVMKSLQVGGMVGAGVRFRTGEKSAVLVQARGLLGLSNLVDDSSISMRSQDVSLVVGYSFGL